MIVYSCDENILTEICFICKVADKVIAGALVIPKCSPLIIPSWHILWTTVHSDGWSRYCNPYFCLWLVPSVTTLYCGLQIFERSVKCRTDKSSSELKEESTVFTEEDFKKFEEEYFVNWWLMPVYVPSELCLLLNCVELLSVFCSRKVTQ